MATLESIARTILKGQDAVNTDANGRFYLDGTMVGVELSRTIADCIYIDEIFRNGQSVTDKYTTDVNAGAIRVKLDVPYPHSSRTIAFGGRSGTTNNGGVINMNAPLLPSDEEFMIFMTQVNDQALLFPQLSKQYIPLDDMAKKIASYSKSVVEDRSASTLAEIIAYNALRALNDGANLNTFDKTADNAYANLFEALNTKLDNGDVVTGAHTYNTTGRCIIGRPAFCNKIFNKNSGVILNGSDIAQAMLKNYVFDTNIAERDFVGNAYKGNTMQFDIQMAPDYIWSLAEKYLGLPAGSFNSIEAIAVSYQANAMGKVIDLGAKAIDANEVRGTKIQPLNIWGHESFRKSQIIGTSALTTDLLSSTLGFSSTVRKYPVAPGDLKNDNGDSPDAVLVPVYDEENNVVGYKKLANIPVPNGGGKASGLPTGVIATPTVTDGETPFTTSTTVKLATATSGASIYYTTDGTTPTKSSTLYTTSGIALSATTTVKAIALKVGMTPSAVLSSTFTKS